MPKVYSTNRTVGIIGLGIMGGAMARALRAAGYAVHGYDPVTAPRGSTTAVAERAPILITSLPSSAALEDAVEKVCRARRRPRVLIEMSTLPLPDKERARRRLARAGVAALDCPVSGTAVRLKQRTWTIFASGDKRALARARAILKVFADNVPYVGAYGNGMRMKFVANHLVAILNVASAEAIGFGRRMGLKPREVLDIFGPSPVVGTGVLRLRGGLMVKRRYKPPTMKIDVWQKDMAIIGAMARRVGARTPLFNACVPLFDRALARGYGDADTAAVYEALDPGI
jgi:3-hydroxyisobutyrate dehydrogenase-like beta-hydroxyacid dehydrogenase